VLLTPDPATAPPTVAELISRTQSIYKGAMVVGENLMSITIGNKVTVSKFVSPKVKSDRTITRF
jgi:hypothetical protein